MPEMSIGAQIAVELQRNRELTAKLYLARGEIPPNDNASQHSMVEEPTSARPRPYEVYVNMPGVDNLFTGLGKRTPTGGFFTS
mmetsp:Transcript_19627/g.55532  ORF Transcript_19627/g.55532 Transcript_19627/m.55532 type:complete len:83 (+) Transcript_19627:145-393(+)